MGQSRWVHLEVERVVGETDSAILVVLEEDYGEFDAGEEVWLPKSQISEPDNHVPGDGRSTVSITEWLANEKGLV
jgi:hypothetical protein